MFLQFHLLTAFPPHNVNRDEDGRPKTVRYGDVQRGRISSQARKRAIRMAGHFAGAEWDGTLGLPPEDGHLRRSTRTREAGLLAYDRLLTAGANPFAAVVVAQAVNVAIGGADKLPKLEDIEKDFAKQKKVAGDDKQALRQRLIAEKVIISPQGLVVSTRELARLDQKLAELLNLINLNPKDDNVVVDWAKRLANDGLLTADDIDEDIALFGRMVAANPERNEEAAVSLSHAITTHAYAPEADYFSAGEELNVQGGTGAAITAYAYFGGGIYYQHAVVDVPHLAKRLGNARAAKALDVLVHGLATAQPRGRRNAFASDTVAGWIALDAGTGPTSNLALAFLNPVTLRDKETGTKGDDLFAASVARLLAFRKTLADAYGGVSKSCVFNAYTPLRQGNAPPAGEVWTLADFQAAVRHAAGFDGVA